MYKRNLFLLIGVFLLFSCLQLNAQNIVPPPNPPRLVVDKAGALLPEQTDILERKLVMIDDSSSNQIAVLIIPTLDDYPIEDYALEVLRKWGIGNKKTNNGVLLLVALNDRKVRIETGYGLEGAIPDITAKSIIDNYITPNFRNGNYYRGIDEATDAIAKAAIGEYRDPRPREQQRERNPVSIFIIILIVFLILRAMGGGGKGGRGGGMVSRRGYGSLFPPIWFGTGGGRGWGGGGGGFGGFGGGGGGGGGASGGW